jgi:hypothetical protein
MEDIITNVNTFSTDDLKYGTPKTNAVGGKSVSIFNTGNNKTFMFMTPLMLTWGVGDYEGNKKYDMALQFRDEDSDEVRSFQDAMQQFENKIKEDAVKYSKEWFGKAKMTPEVIDALWTPMLKYSKDKLTGEPDTSKPPSMRVKVEYYESNIEQGRSPWGKTEIYDLDYNLIFPQQDSQETPLTLIGKGSNTATLIRSGGIWFANGKFGVTWKLGQAIVKPRNAGLGVCKIRLGDSDRATLASASVESDEDDIVQKTTVEDDDEEEQEAEEAEETEPEEEEEEEEEPVPPPTPVKKVKRVVKKKAATVSAE